MTALTGAPDTATSTATSTSTAAPTPAPTASSPTSTTAAPIEREMGKAAPTPEPSAFDKQKEIDRKKKIKEQDDKGSTFGEKFMADFQGKGGMLEKLHQIGDMAEKSGMDRSLINMGINAVTKKLGMGEGLVNEMKKGADAITDAVKGGIKDAVLGAATGGVLGAATSGIKNAVKTAFVGAAAGALAGAAAKHLGSALNALPNSSAATPQNQGQATAQTTASSLLNAAQQQLSKPKTPEIIPTANGPKLP